MFNKHILVTITEVYHIATRLCHTLMWSRQGHNLPPQTLVYYQMVKPCPLCSVTSEVS